jgi:PAS domain S-box-containing protein
MAGNKKYSSILLSILLAIPVIVIIGWTFDIEIFKRFRQGLVAMHPVTALTFVVTVVSLILIRCDKKRKLTPVVNLLSFFVFVVGLLGIARQIGLPDFEINHWLFPHKVDSPYPNLSTIIAPNTAAGIIIAGVALFDLNNNRRKAVIADFAALITAFIGFLSVIGYLYHAKEFYEMKSFVPMAFPTAVCLILFSLAIFSYKKKSGFTKEITSKYGGGQISSLLIPVAVIIPFILGYLRIESDETAYLSSSFSTALVAIAGTAISVFFIWMISASINRSNANLVREISARRKIENQLKQSNEFLDTVLDNVPVMIFVKEAKQLKYIRINKATEQFLKMRKEEVVEKTDYDLFETADADFIRNIDLEALRKGEMVFVEEQRLVFNNNEWWLASKRIPLKNSNDKGLYLIGIAIDITAQKKQIDRISQFNKELEKKVKERTEELIRSESLFRSLIENSADAIKMMDADWNILFASRSNEKLLGYHPSEMIHRSWLSFVYADDINQAKALIAEVNLNPGVPHGLCIRLVNKAGNYIWSEGTVTNLLNEESVRALVCNFHDVTEKVTAEKEKQLLEKSLMEEKIHKQKEIARATIDGQEKERKAIAMELHDNINQVLGVIKLYIGMARKVPTATTEMLDKSYESIDFCINEIKNLSKRLMPPGLQDGISEAIERLIENVEEASNIEIIYSGCANLSTKIDERKQLSIYRIVQELLTNIIKHASATKVLLSLKEENGQIIIDIVDNGKGFNTFSAKKGLGLQNIQNRVEVYNGTFKITSAENEGTTATVSIPGRLSRQEMQSSH